MQQGGDNYEFALENPKSKKKKKGSVLKNHHVIKHKTNKQFEKPEIYWPEKHESNIPKST